MTDGNLTQVLVVDDEQSILSAIARSLHGQPIQLHFASSGAEALHLCNKERFDIIISDQRMPKMTGTELMAEIRVKQPHSQRVILSAYADFNDIVGCFNEGLIHRFINKPWTEPELLSVISMAEASTAHNIGAEFHKILSASENMRVLFSKINKAARANVPVFVCGESGSGKELVAKALHNESSRKEQPYVAFNCANFNDSLIESQLFGHVKGAFTGASSDTSGLFEAVGEGSLFLDEITSMPLSLQAKLLRVLQEREYSPVGSQKLKPFLGQVICASNKSLREAVKDSNFREDLRYRLEVILLEIPPLRQRPEDINLLLQNFLQQANPGQHLLVDEATLKRLRDYTWPGNVRQLQNVALYLSAMVEGQQITLSDLPDELLTPDTVIASNHPPHETTTHIIPQPIQLNDQEMIETLLKECSGNKSEVARQLGVSRMTLWRHLKRFNLTS